MAYKNVQHYRHTVHRYLDAIWVIGCHKGKARTLMYKWLSKQMNLEFEKTHVKWFTRDQCKQAIKILRPMYIQLYGHDLPWRKKENMEKEEAEELANELSGSYWNYRWLKVVVECDEYDDDGNPTGEKYNEIYYALHEVYYDRDEKPFMWTKNPVKLYADDAETLFELIGKMLNAAMEKVLIVEDNKIKELDEYMDKHEVLKQYRKEKK